jgi:hypothetical protein
MDDGEHEPSGADLEVEIADLSRSGRARERRGLGRGLTPRRRFWRLAGAAAIVGLVTLLLALDLPGRLTPQPPAPLTLRPQAEGVTCLLDAAWSPQSTHIALLGDQHARYCPANTSGQKAGLVTVFDATSGKLLGTLHPDDALVRAIQAFARRMVPASRLPVARIAPAIAYQHVLWSPDGRRMALTFSLAVASIGLNLSAPDGEPEDLHGVVVLDANGARPQVLMRLESAYESFAMDEWDLQAGAVSAAAPSPDPTFGVLVPALAYRWQAGATPSAAAPLSAMAPPPVPPLGPVGNPDGGSAFTIWQPGVATGVARMGPDGLSTHLAGVYELTGAFETWSPDGRYLLDAVVPDGLLELPGTPPPTADALNAYGVAGIPLLPLRDAGLARALRAVNPLNPVGTFTAWRSDGRVLAAYAPEHMFAVPPMTIYDCATGRQLTTLLPPAAGDASVTTPLLGQSTLLRWSPDGAHLLLYALALGQVVVWGPQQLPG